MGVGRFTYHAGNSTSCDSIEEGSPSRILVICDRAGFDSGGNKTSEAVGTFFSLRRR